MTIFRRVFSIYLISLCLFFSGFAIVLKNISHASGIQDLKVGISGTFGVDTIVNDEFQDILSDLATASPEDVITCATGIDGLAGNDTLTNNGYMDLDSSSVIDVPYTPTETIGIVATSDAIGINGGDGMDMLTNTAPIWSTADAFAYIFEVIIQIDPGILEAPTSAIASATGIQGGDHPDSIDNISDIFAAAISESEVQESHVSAVEIPLEIFAYGDGKTIATSTSIAIDGDMQSGTPVITSNSTEAISSSGVLSAQSDARATKYIGMIELLGAARVDDNTLAQAYSAGIFGGVNDNIITNTGSIDVDAVSNSDMTSWEIKMKGLMLKPAMDQFGLDVGTYKTTADSLAVGIFGNTGNNEIFNNGSTGIDVFADATADSEIYTFSISPPVSLSASGLSSALASMAMASLPDLIPVIATGGTTENGSTAAYGDARTKAEATAFGMLSGQGDDILKNNVALSSAADADASNHTYSLDINIEEKSYLPIPGAAVADASTTAIALSSGLDGGSGSDGITNTSSINATARADADSLGIAATIKGSMKGLSAGVAVTDSSSAAISSAKGITGGTGGDTITNSGSVTAYSDAQDDAVSVSMTLAGNKAGIAAGVTMADALTRSNAYSFGIDAENIGADESESLSSQIDDITNSGEISATAIAGSHADAVSVSVAASLEGVAVSVALAETDVKSETQAVGIRSGIGKDRIENKGAGGIHAISTATSSSDSVAVSVSGAYKGVSMGASYAEANTEAFADSAGIDSGNSDDTILNHAGMDTTSTANVDSDTIAITATVAIYGFSAGVAMSDTQTNSDATATGITAGDGDDTVENTATMTTIASANTKTNTITINFAEAGAAISDVSSAAVASSTGINLAEGIDDVINTGTLEVSATAVSDDTSTEVNLAGYAAGDIGSASTAGAVGIFGGDGTHGETDGDTLINGIGGNINVTSTANAFADNYGIQGGGLQLANVGSKTSSSAAAIKTGVMGDTIENEGIATAIANSEIRASNFNFQLSGVQLGSVGVNAVATARGIDAGDGLNTITNKKDGVINTYADLSTTALNTEAGFGAQFVHSGITSEAYSQGIFSGMESDTIENEGTINASANSLGQAGGASIGIISASLVNALASADIDGINAGGNNDIITNNGTITAGAIKAGDSYLVKADTTAVAFDFVSLVFSSLGADALITGIQGASGNDTIVNNGTIYIGDETPDDACTNQRSMVIGKSYGFGGQFLGGSLAFAGSSARATSVGIDGGADNDTLRNEGSITVKARSYADVDAETYVTFGLFKSLANADAGSSAGATALYGGSGDDTIKNFGFIIADALTIADASSNAEVDLFANPYAESEATATARAAGIDAGTLGDKLMDNYGGISVVANAGARPHASSESAFMRTHADGYGLAKAEAYGMTSQSTHNYATNHDTGSIVVQALAGTYDTLGNIGYSYADEDANIDAGYYNAGSNQWTPLSAKASGILFLDGDDIIVNDGTITVTSSTNGSVYAKSDSWPMSTSSTARSVVLSQTKGISAGKGQNEVTNNGHLTIQALSHAEPKAYSWSRDSQATATAYGVSTAEATGIEADGNTLNSSSGVLDVTARATSWAHADTASETVDVTAVLSAYATGFSLYSDTGLSDLQTITNDGGAMVKALSGEDAMGHSQQIAWVDTRISVEDDTGNCTGTSTADAAGIRAGEGLKEITNNGTLTVLGRARADLTTAGGAHTYVRSRYHNPKANSYATGISTATGILVSGGENHIYNNAIMDVEAKTSDVYAWSDSYSSWSSCYSTAESHAESTGQGIITGDGNDEIINAGTLSVTSSARSKSYAYANTRDNNLANERETSHAAATAVAVGINGGKGINIIENQEILNVKAGSLAENNYGGGHASVTTSSASDATAIGIQVGDGGSFIYNTGTLSVEALALYDVNPSFYWADAIGILGGAGDDEIINKGTITSARSFGNFMSQDSLATYSGTGINAGGGNDIVVLEDGSSVEGAIFLGSGNDTLILRGSPVIKGDLYTNQGNDSLVLDGPGSFDHHLTGFNNASKYGQGTYMISRLDPVTSLHVNQGKFQVNSDYAFNSSGILTTSVLADGGCGNFDIVGTGDLDGAIEVSREDVFYSDAMIYDIITANVLNGEFNKVVLPESTSLLAFSMKQTPGTIEISATPKSCTSVAVNGMEEIVGAYLDKIAPRADGDLAQVLKTFQVLSPQEFQLAFSGMSSANYGGISATGHYIARNAMQPITDHLQAKRTSSPLSPGSFTAKTPVLFSQNNDYGPAGLMLNSNPDDQTATFEFWIKGFGRWGAQDGSDGYTGYDFSTYGVALGVEYLFQDWLFGVSVEKSNSNQDFDSNSGDGTIQTIMASLYADFYFNDFYLESILSYGRQSYDNRRNIIIGNILREAKSMHDGNLFSAYLEGGYELVKGPWIVAPFGDIQYTILDEDGFTETGAGVLNLMVDEKTTKALVSKLGIHVSRPFKKQMGDLVPKFSLAGIFDFDIDDRAITAGFSGSPEDSFIIDDQEVDRLGIAVETELSWRYKSGFEMSVNYSGEFRDTFRMHTVTGKLQSSHGFSTSIGFSNNFQNNRSSNVILGKIQIDF